MRQVAATAGVTKSLIHHHFHNKVDLWREVIQRLMSSYFEKQKAMLLQGYPNRQLLEDSIRVYYQTLKENPKFVQVLGRLMTSSDLSCHEIGEDVTELGIRRLMEGQELGFLRKDVHPAHILMMFLGMIDYWFLSNAQGGGAHGDARLSCQTSPTDPKALGVEDGDVFLEDFIKIFFEGLLPR
jgi:TetR/AcrR family transcriptional regulator